MSILEKVNFQKYQIKDLYIFLRCLTNKKYKRDEISLQERPLLIMEIKVDYYKTSQSFLSSIQIFSSTIVLT